MEARPPLHSCAQGIATCWFTLPTANNCSWLVPATMCQSPFVQVLPAQPVQRSQRTPARILPVLAHLPTPHNGCRCPCNDAKRQAQGLFGRGSPWVTPPPLLLRPGAPPPPSISILYLRPTRKTAALYTSIGAAAPSGDCRYSHTTRVGKVPHRCVTTQHVCRVCACG